MQTYSMQNDMEQKTMAALSSETYSMHDGAESAQTRNQSRIFLYIVSHIDVVW